MTMVILVTGASSGLGKASADKLVSEGHTVYGTSRSKEGMLDGVFFLKADSSSDGDVRKAVDTVLEREGRIDVLINNAGMGIAGPFEFCTEEDCLRQMDINFMGAVRYARAVIPAMRRRRSGHIICVSSVGGRVGLPFQSMYSASKFAIEGWCEAMRLEVMQFGIKVTTVAPGDFHTGFTAQRKAVSEDNASAVYADYGRSLGIIEKNELGGLEPEVFAEAILKLTESSSPAYRRIVATFVQKLSVTARAILPGPVFAWIMKLYYKL